MVNAPVDNDKFWSDKTTTAVNQLQVCIFEMHHEQLTLMVLWLADKLEAPKEIKYALLNDSDDMTSEDLHGAIVKLIARAISSVAKRVGAYAGPNRETTIALEEILFQAKAILTLTETAP